MEFFEKLLFFWVEG